MKISPSYEGQLRIWVVGVRDRNRQGTVWGELWKPTSLRWFGTRSQCWVYIRNEINKENFKWLEYKPLRYAQWEREK